MSGYVEMLGLPPRPDRETGEPRPPRAPNTRGDEDESYQMWDAKRVPTPPEDKGPPLQWHVLSHPTTRLGMFALLLVAMVAFLIVREGTDTDPGPYGRWSWLGSWKVWLFLSALCAGYVWYASRTKLSAGAEWLMDRSSLVMLYELSEIRVYRKRLHLRDIHGGIVRPHLSEVQENQDLWDLVYNGIVHSVVNGAWLSQRAMGELYLRALLIHMDNQGIPRSGARPASGEDD